MDVFVEKLNEKTMDSFDVGFNKLITATIEYELLRQQDKLIPDELLQRLDESSAWLRGLSDEDYSRLIH